MRRRGIFIGIAVTFCAATFLFFLLGNPPPKPANTSASFGSPQYWKTDNNQISIKNNTITFALKDIEISHQEIRFFYARKSSQNISLQAIETIHQASTILLSTQDESLGTLGAYTIGVLHVRRIDRAGQVITIQMKIAGHSNTWSLSPLQQLLLDNRPNTTVSIFVDQRQLPDITWSGPVMDQQVAYMQDISTSHINANTAHIFLRLDDPIKVQIISQAQFIAIAGKQNYP